MENIKYYLQSINGLEEARDAAVEDIAYIISDELNTYEQLELINDLTQYEVHEMDDLNDEYRHWDAREILESLKNIDPWDDFFEKEDAQSADDPFYLADCTAQGLAQKIFDDDIAEYSFERKTLEEFKNIEYSFQRVEEKRNIAKYLIDTADISELDEMITLLWNRKEM